MTPHVEPARRTQAERKATTLAKVLSAGAEILVESGYAGASIQRVAERAGVSVGGILRHLPTREALMVAVGEDVAKRMLAQYRADFEGASGERDPIARALLLLRRATRSDVNQAWLELVHACRTEPALRAALEPVGRAYVLEIEALGRALLPDLARSLGANFPLFVRAVVALFDGEQLEHMLYEDPETESAMMTALVTIGHSLAPPSGAPTKARGPKPAGGKPTHAPRATREGSPARRSRRS